ncbi:MAG: RHS repeat-associated core domain-containing protein [Sedimentisphaerales bacterium]
MFGKQRFSFKSISLIIIATAFFNVSPALFAAGSCPDNGYHDDLVQEDCMTNEHDTFELRWVNKPGISSGITLTVGGCENSAGDSGAGIVYRTNKYICDCSECGCPGNPSCNYCEPEHNCNMSGPYPYYSVTVTGSQEDFDEFLSGGIGLLPVWGGSITKVGCEYIFYIAWYYPEWPHITVTASNPKGKPAGTTASFGLLFKEWSEGLPCRSIKDTTGGSITVKVVSDSCITTSSPTSPVYMQKITRVYGPVEQADPEWIHYSYFASSCDPGDCECILDQTSWSEGTSSATYYVATTPCWTDTVSNTLPGYMQDKGWESNHSEPNNWYLYQDMGSLGKTYYYCTTASLTSEDKKLVSSVEYRTGSQAKGEGTTLWHYTYDSNDRITYIYDGSTVQNSYNYYEYDWTDGDNNNVEADIDYYSNNTLLRQWHREYDEQGQVIESYSGGGCSSCGGSSGGFERQEYYYTSDYNDNRFEDLVKRKFNAAGDITEWNIYDPNTLTDPNFSYLGKPLLSSQYAVQDPDGNNITVKIKNWVYDPNNLNAVEYSWIDNGRARVVKYYYKDESLSAVTGKAEYVDLYDGNFPTGSHYTTYYDYNDTDSSNRIQTTTYASNSRKDIEISNSESLVVKSYVHDINNDANANVESFTYSGGDVDTHTDARGGQTNYVYSGSLLTRQTDPQTDAGRQITEYQYNGNRKVIEEKHKDTDGNWAITAYDYNSVTFRLDSMTTDKDGDNQAITYYKYNSLDEIIREKSPTDIITGKSYNLAGQVWSEFIASDSNAFNELNDSELILVSQTKYTYDGDGRVVTISKAKDSGVFDFNQPDGWIVTKYEYDFLGRKTKTIEDYGNDNLTTEYEYNNQGEVIKVTEPSGKWTETIRDGRGLTIQTIVGYGSNDVLLTDYEYDANKNLIQQTNPDGTIELFEYDNFDRLVKRQKLDINGPYTVYEYDNAGSITRETNYDVNDVMLTDSRTEYDVLGRIISTRILTVPDSPDDLNDRITLYQYDIAGNRIKTIYKGYGSNDANDPNESNDIIITAEYDSLNRPTKTIDGAGGQTSYTYNDAGQILTTTDPNGFVATNYYDLTGRLEKVKNAEGHYTVYYYSSLNQIYKQIAYDCNGTPSNENDDFAVEQIRFEYDNLGHITRRAVMKNSASSASISISVDMATDYIYDSSTGLPEQEKHYYNGSETATTTFYYDGIGRRIRVVDSENNEDEVFYNSSTGQITSQQRTEYDSNNPNNSITITTLLSYDDYGRLYQKTLDDNNSTEFDDLITTYYYDDLNRKIRETAPDGVSVVFEYDSFGNLTKKTEDPNSVSEPNNLNRITEYTFDRLGRQIAIKGYDGNDPDGQITTYGYDKNNQVTKITYPDSNSIEYFYNLLGKVDEEIQRDGSHFYYGYDKLGNETFESDDPNGDADTADFLVEFDYDGANRLIYTAKTLDSSTITISEFTYNGFGLKTSETEKLFNLAPVTVEYEYDNSGNIIAVTHSGQTVDYAYDGLGRIKEIQRSDANIAEYSYLGANTGSIKYPEPDLISENVYDEIGRITRCQSTDSDNNSILDLQYTYDDASNRTSVKYNHLATPVWDKYTYDRLQRIIAAEYGSDTGLAALSNQQNDIYLAAQIGLRWVEELTADYTDYADKDSVKSVVKNKNISVSSARPEPVERVSSVAKRDLPVMTFAELADADELREKTKTEILKDDSGNTICEIVYDSSGRIISFKIYPDIGGSTVIETAYDSSGNVESEVAKTYDANGLLVSTEDMTVLATEDTEITENIAAKTLIREENISVDETSDFQSSLFNLQLDMMIVGSSPQGSEYHTEEFTLDLLGNRLSYFLNETDANYTYYHNGLNQYAKIHHNWANIITDDANYSYDDKGNLESDDYTDFGYEYDWRNRLTKVTYNMDTVAEFAYDALGRRISKTVDGETTYYYYDTMGRVIAEYTGAAESNSVSLARTFVYGNGIDEVLAMFLPETEPYVDANDINWLVGFCNEWLCDSGCTYDEDSDNDVDFEDYAIHLRDNPWSSNLNDLKERHFYYLKDALGSVMAVVGGQYNRDADREFYIYDVYGMPQGSEQSPSKNPYGFQGKRFDTETGLYFYETRYYEPELGRFISSDLLGIVPNAQTPNYFYPVEQYRDGLGLYQAFNSNPVTSIDSFGLACIGGACSLPFPPTPPPILPFAPKLKHGRGNFQCCGNVSKAMKIANSVMGSTGACGKWFSGRIVIGASYKVDLKKIAAFPAWTIAGTNRIGVAKWACSYPPVGMATLLIHEVAHHFCPPLIFGGETCANSAVLACESELVDSVSYKGGL